ncbi:MAG: T9SS type A sorting domain-containing protein [Saprospiraceae bacterium]|nr:T9SS type A sorting domain-containing protein [Saprospiraceae bacterium]
MKKNTQIAFFLLFPTFLVGQGGIVNNGAEIIVTTNTKVKVNNASIENKGVGVISNTGKIYVDQDWIQTGSAIYIGDGELCFEGTSNQNISSTSTLTVSKLQVNSGQRLVLGNDVIVSTSVDLMNNGSLELGNNNLTMSSGAIVSNYDASSFIITNGTGFLKQEVGTTSVVFPVGNSSYNPATLTNAGDIDNLSIRVLDQVFSSGASGTAILSDVVNRTWMIEEDLIGGSDVTVLLQWNTADELSGFDRALSGIAHYTNGGLWDNPSTYTAATALGTAWTQSRTGLTSFSPFVVRGQNMVLPIKLLDFDVERISKVDVALEWSTASETNNEGFEVERMLDNETTFSKVAWLEGQGTTLNTSHYYFKDPNAYSGISYYRLKQLDTDGGVSYSLVKTVKGIREASEVVTVFPNPASDCVYIRLFSSATEVTIRIFDTKGALVLSERHNIPNSEMIEINNLSHLADALYTITITTENGDIYSNKFIKE